MPVAEMESVLPAESPLPHAVALMREAASDLGYSFTVLDAEFGHLFELSDGRTRRVFLGGRSPLNDALSARLADDKYYTELLLGRAGFRVPRSVRCFKPGWCQGDCARPNDLAPVLGWAQETGYPLVVKPNLLSHGRCVQVVRDLEQLQAAIRRVWDFDYLALVQTAHSGLDVRLDFLDGEYLLGYTRRPAAHAKAGDIRILNLALGAQADLLPTIPDRWRAHSLAIGRALRLRYFGIDFKAPSWAADPAEATVIEVNASPLFVQMALQGHRAAALSAQKRVLQAVWSQS